MFEKMKLGPKFGVAGIALLLPIVGLIAAGREEAKELVTQRGEFSEAKAQKVVEVLDRNLFERYGDVQAFTFNGTAHNKAQWYKKESKLVDAIDAYVDAYDVYALSMIVDADGKVVAVNSKDEDGKELDTKAVWAENFKGEKWFADAMSERFTTSARHATPENSKATGTVMVDVHSNALLKEVYGDHEFAIGFAAPLRDDDGKPIAVWYNLLDFTKLEAILGDEYKDTQKDLPSTHFILFNGSGRVIANYDPSKGITTGEVAALDRLTEAERQSGSAKRALAGEQGFVLEAVPGDKEEVMSGFAHSTGAMGFPGLDWSLVVRNDRSELLSVSDASGRWVWASAITSVLALALVALFVVRSISRPLTAMTKAAKRLSEGDVTVSIEHRGGDEIGQLSDALRGVMDWVQGVSRAAESISRGDLSQVVQKRSSADILSESFARVQGAIVAVDNDSNRLIDAVRSGKLDVRADAAKHEGAYAKLIEGLNRMVATAAEPIGEAKSVLSSVANRDLSRRMQGRYEGDWDSIKTSLNQAIDNLDESLGQVTVAAEQVTTAANEITIGNQSLAQIATEQASSLDSVTNRLQEVTTAGQQTAGNAQQARGMANAANDAAERGAQNMSGLSQAIEQIKSASDRTAQIVKTIDEIAFQTNLLALNAAVEAARAGDAGKGFAVVAEEVRNLAMRSADAARSTSQMIEDAVKSAERGVNLNASVAKNFTEIRSQVGRVVEVMSEIAAAAETQSQGVVDINHMVTELSKATQQNAATTEESASAAEELSGQAESLKDLVGTFQLQNGMQGHAPPRRQGRTAARPQPPRLPTSTHKAPVRVTHLRSVPPPPKQAASVSRGAQLIPFDDSDGNTALAEF